MVQSCAQGKSFSSCEQDESGSTSNSKKRKRNVSAKAWFKKLGAKPSSEKDPPSNGIKGVGANTSDEENHIKIDAVPV